MFSSSETFGPILSFGRIEISPEKISNSIKFQI
jgi:hypothetical protein